MTFRLASELAENPDLMAAPEVVAAPCGVAGRVGLLTLGPKGGKSSTGGAIVAEASHRGVRCGILTLDEALQDTLQRLVRYSAALGLVYLNDRFEPEVLEDEIATFGLEVLIVDHLGKIAEAHPDHQAGSQGDPLLWGRLVAPFTALARSRDLAVILLDQARKSDGKYAGSTAKAGSVDFLVEMAEKDGGLEATPRGRVLIPPFRVELDSEGIPRFSGGAGSPKPEAAPEAPKVRELLQLLSDSEPEGLTSAAWMRMSGQPKQTYNRHRKALLRQGYALAPDVTRGGRYRITDRGEESLGPLVPSVPPRYHGTTVPIGRDGTIGTKHLEEVLVRGISQDSETYEGTEREAIASETAA